MRRLLLSLTVLASLSPAALASAAQAAWSELPPYAQPGGAVATCVRAVRDGEISLLGRIGSASIATDLLTVGDGGLSVGSSSDLGWLAACAEVASAPGDAPADPTVIAGAGAVAPLLVAKVAVPHAGAPGGRVAGTLQVADAGLPSATLRSAEAATIGELSVATAPGGAAVVAWSERRTVSAGDTWGLRGGSLYAAVRAPGATAFGNPRLLDSSATADAVAAPSAGIDASGRATVVWASPNPDTSRDFDAAIVLADLRADGTVVQQQLTTSLTGVTALAVAPDGAVLVAAATADGTEAFERAAGAAGFTPARLPGEAFIAAELAVALAPGGGAVIAARLESDGVQAHVRPAGGRFGPVQLVAGRLPEQSTSRFTIVPSTITGDRPVAPNDVRGRELAAALDARGGALLTWTRAANDRSSARAHAASGTLRTGFAAPAALGSRCRSASSARPVKLADGRLAAAWADNSDSYDTIVSDLQLGGGRLHVALPGTTAPATTTPPQLGARVVGSRKLRVGQPLRLRVRCAAGPCDVRVKATLQVRDSEYHLRSERSGATAALQAGRARELQMLPRIPRTLLARGGRPQHLALTVLACTPGGAVAERLSLRPLLRGVAAG